MLEDTLDWPSESVGMVVFLFLFRCFTAFQNSFALAELRLQKNVSLDCLRRETTLFL